MLVQGLGSPCSVVKWCKEESNQVLTLFVGHGAGWIRSFVFDESMRSMRKKSAASVGSGVKCLASAGGILLVGCADGSLRLLPLVGEKVKGEKGEGSFGSEMSLWPSLHSKSSPAISSISIALSPTGCFVTSGAENGNVAIFTLAAT